MAEIEPGPDNDYQVQSTAAFSRELWNIVMASIAARLKARELLEATFEALITQGTQAALDMISQNIAPQLAALTTQMNNLEAALEELIGGGIAPNSLQLGGKNPDFYLALANATGTLPAEKVAGLTAAIQLQIDALKNAAPEVLDTFKEIADALGNNQNLATDVMAALATKLVKSANLSDLTDIVAARANLSLYSKAETDTKLGTKFNNTGGGISEDVTIYRSAAPATGALWLGQSGYRIYWSGSAFDFNGKVNIGSGGMTITGPIHTYDATFEIEGTQAAGVYLWLHRPNVKRGCWHVGGGGELHWLDQGGQSHFQISPAGAVWTQQFGDLSSRIEDRAYVWAEAKRAEVQNNLNALAGDSVRSVRLVGLGEAGVDAGGGNVDFQPNVVTGGRGSAYGYNVLRYRTPQKYHPNSGGWVNWSVE